MTKKDLISLSKTLPKKWYIDSNTCRPCFEITLEDGQKVTATYKYERIKLVTGKVYDSKEECEKALRELRTRKKKEEKEALEYAARILNEHYYSFREKYKTDEFVKNMVDAAASVHLTINREIYEQKISLLVNYINTGMINIGPVSFRKEEVASVKYGAPLDKWEKKTIPVKVTLKNGEDFTTKTVIESWFLQKLFGPNLGDYTRTDVVWPNPKTII